MRKSEFMVCQHMEFSSFKEVPEILDGKVNGEEFTIICVVSVSQLVSGLGRKMLMDTTVHRYAVGALHPRQYLMHQSLNL